MPLDPSISLQAHGVTITPPDPVTTLVQVAQLRQMQSQDQMRQLQMAQLGNTLGEYQRVQAPLAALRQMNQGGAPGPGMVPGNQLGSLPPGSGMPGQGPPAGSQEITQTPLLPSPSPQAAYPNGPPPDASQLPQGPQQPQVAPAAPQTSPRPQAAPFPSLEALDERMKLIRTLSYGGPAYGQPMATHIMDLDTKELALRKQMLELQAESAKRTSEVVAGIKDDVGYQEARRLTAQFAPHEAAQMPATFDHPMAKAWLAYRQGIAQTEEQRVQTRLKEADQAIQMYTAETGRLAEGRQARAVTVQPTASGTMLQQVSPAPGTTGTTPMVGPGGQPALPPEYGKNKEFYDAQGNVHIGSEYTPPGQQPTVQRPRMAPTPVPGYSAPAGGAPQAGQPPQLMNQNAVQSNLQVGRDVQKAQLDAAIPQAEAARNSLNTLAQMKQLMHEGYYDDLFAKDLAGADAQKILIANGRDPQKTANTFKIQNLANQLVIDAQGGRGLRVGPTEIGKLNAASGRLDTIPPKAAALQMVEQLRQLTTKDLEHYNTLTQSPNTPQLRPYAIPQTVPKAEFERRYTALKAANPQLTRDELALRYERAGAHVEGAY